jgi:hypothetical protein
MALTMPIKQRPIAWKTLVIYQKADVSINALLAMGLYPRRTAVVSHTQETTAPILTRLSRRRGLTCVE